MISHFRGAVNDFTHLAGVVFTIPAMFILLVFTYHDMTKMLSMLVYGLSLITLYRTNTAFHLAKGTPSLINRLRRVDHAAIYLFIAGIYTPFCYNTLPEWWRWGRQELFGLWRVSILYKIFERGQERMLSVLLCQTGLVRLVDLPEALNILATEATA